MNDLSSVFAAGPFVPDIFTPEMKGWLATVVPGSPQYESLPPLLRAWVDGLTSVATAIQR